MRGGSDDCARGGDTSSRRSLRSWPRLSTTLPHGGRRWPGPGQGSTTRHGDRRLHLRGCGQAVSLSPGRRGVTAPRGAPQGRPSRPSACPYWLKLRRGRGLLRTVLPHSPGAGDQEEGGAAVGLTGAAAVGLTGASCEVVDSSALRFLTASALEEKRRPEEEEEKEKELLLLEVEEDPSGWFESVDAGPTNYWHRSSRRPVWRLPTGASQSEIIKGREKRKKTRRRLTRKSRWRQSSVSS